MYNSIIQTCVKDEDHILKEWIVYHLLLGFDHIYIYMMIEVVYQLQTVLVFYQSITEKKLLYLD